MSPEHQARVASGSAAHAINHCGCVNDECDLTDGLLGMKDVGDVGAGDGAVDGRAALIPLVAKRLAKYALKYPLALMFRVPLSREQVEVRVQQREIRIEWRKNDFSLT